MPSRQITTRTTATTIPTTQHQQRQLETIVPACAQSCFESRIENFDCANTNDLSCLCSKYSSDGFTLGEIAFKCLLEQCSDSTTADQSNAFNICGSKPKHVIPTHTILTIDTPTATSTSTGTSILTASLTYNPTAAATQSSVAAPSATLGSYTAPGNGTAGGSSLTTAQAVGVSVASIGGMILAIILVYLINFLRRRRLQLQAEKHDSYDFIDEAPPRFAPLNFGRFEERGPYAPAELPCEKRNTNWPRQDHLHSRPQPSSSYGHEKDADHSLQVAYGGSPDSHCSNSSQRTTSQLLPAKPERSFLGPPSRSPYRGGLATPATVFEEDAAPRAPARFGLPGKSIKLKRSPQYAKAYTTSPEPIHQPSLSIEIPKRPMRSESIQVVAMPPARAPACAPAAGQNAETLKEKSSTQIPASLRIPFPPLPLRVRTSDGEYPPRTSVHSKTSKASRPGSILDYYTGADGASSKTEISSHESTTPIEESQASRPTPAVTVTKPTYPPRGNRMSTLSDASHRTSFESNDPEEETPPEELERSLTPVGQSPIETSPISDIRYPKVPRPSNQAVPRSPFYHGSFSGSTLAARRRGDSVAQDLRLKGSSHGSSPSTREAEARLRSRQMQRQESPLRGYGQSAEPDWPLPATVRTDITRPSAPAPRQSDLWEPKLTPRREGGDLYLSVSVATPQQPTFSGRK